MSYIVYFIELLYILAEIWFAVAEIPLYPAIVKRFISVSLGPDLFLLSASLLLAVSNSGWPSHMLLAHIPDFR